MGAGGGFHGSREAPAHHAHGFHLDERIHPPLVAGATDESVDGGSFYCRASGNIHRATVEYPAFRGVFGLYFWYLWQWYQLPIMSSILVRRLASPKLSAMKRVVGVFVPTYLHIVWGQSTSQQSCCPLLNVGEGSPPSQTIRGSFCSFVLSTVVRAPVLPT